MKRILFGAVLLCLAIGPSNAVYAVEPAQDAHVRIVDLNEKTPDFSRAFERLIADAKARHMTAFVQASAQWCGPCKRLRAAMPDPLMQSAMRGTYLIRVDVDAWSDELDDAGLLPKGVPTIFAIDMNGKPTGKTITGAAWDEDIPVNIAPVMGKFFADNRWR